MGFCPIHVAAEIALAWFERLMRFHERMVLGVA